MTTFQKIFPSATTLEERYTVLQGKHYLLPFVWVYRWVLVIFTRRENIKKQADELQMLAKQNVDEYRESLNYVGLDFNFTE